MKKKLSNSPSRGIGGGLTAGAALSSMLFSDVCTRITVHFCLVMLIIFAV